MQPGPLLLAALALLITCVDGGGASGATGSLFSGKSIRAYPREGTPQHQHTLFATANPAEAADAATPLEAPGAQQHPSSSQSAEQPSLLPTSPEDCLYWGVVTTINPPSEAVLGLCKRPRVCCVVVADTKTPVGFADALASAINSNSNSTNTTSGASSSAAPSNKTSSGAATSEKHVVYLSVEAQQRLFSQALLDIIPWRHFGRKNLGYLYAAHHRAKAIWDFDDDNILEHDFITPLLSDYGTPGTAAPHTAATAHSTSTPATAAPSTATPPTGPAKAAAPGGGATLLVRRLQCGRMVNPYKGVRSSNEAVWPRGLPLSHIRRTPNCSTTLEELPLEHVGVVQSFAEGDPDVDAVYRLTQPLPVTFSSSPYPLLISPSALAPYNAQATLHLPPMFWATLLPITVHGRVSDIYRGYIAQAIARYTDSRLLFLSQQAVVQERNSHSYLRDFAAEQDLYLKLNALLAYLSRWRPSSPDLPTALLDLYVQLYERDFLQLADVKLAEAWVSILTHSGYAWPRLQLAGPGAAQARAAMQVQAQQAGAHAAGAMGAIAAAPSSTQSQQQQPSQPSQQHQYQHQYQQDPGCSTAEYVRGITFSAADQLGAAPAASQFTCARRCCGNPQCTAWALQEGGLCALFGAGATRQAAAESTVAGVVARPAALYCTPPNCGKPASERLLVVVNFHYAFNPAVAAKLLHQVYAGCFFDGADVAFVSGSLGPSLASGAAAAASSPPSNNTSSAPSSTADDTAQAGTAAAAGAAAGPGAGAAGAAGTAGDGDPPLLQLSTLVNPLSQEGFYSYSSLSLAHAAYPGYKGYLLTNDDVLHHAWRFGGVDWSKPWIANQFVAGAIPSIPVPPTCPPPEHQWVWWDRVRDQPTLSDTFCAASSKALARLRADYGLANATRIAFCKADTYYVPGHLMLQYRQYTRAFLLTDGFLEHAVPTVLQLLEANSLLFCESSAAGSANDGACMVTHPVKLSQPAMLERALTDGHKCEAAPGVASRGNAFAPAAPPLFMGQ